MYACVHFVGRRFDWVAIVKACDLFVLPSLREGHSITIIETMAAEVPIVATNIHGIKESVWHEREPLLVPPCNAAALVDVIVCMLRDQSLANRHKQTARQRFLDNFTEEKMLQRSWKVYRKLLTSKGLP